MSLIPKSHEEFSQKEYWESFFKKRGSKSFEWYGDYHELSGYLHKYIKQQDIILIPGCGNSTLGQNLHDVGYSNITNIDISQVVIRQMNQNSVERPNLKYILMDALNTTFDDEKFSVVLDKGTLDALMPDDKEETLRKVEQYFKEIHRITRVGGRFICISLLQEHIIKKILNYFPSNNWSFRVVRCLEVEKKAMENGEKAMPVFMVICIKFRASPRLLLEANFSSDVKVQRYEDINEIVSHVAQAQKAAFVCSSLQHMSIANENEVTLDLFQPGNDIPRYSVFVVDVPGERKSAEYAAFVVPQGRETEWLFSTKDGRKHLVTMTKHKRLTIVTMHRGHKYGSFEDVQDELSETICTLAPVAMKNQKIPFLSLGSDVDNRTIRFEHHSDFSGDYVVEDVEIDSEKLRRLVFLSSRLVVQSEAKLKTIKTRKGILKDVVDLTYLKCKHHIYMSLAAHVAYAGKPSPSVAVIGLGGGGMCSFLHKFLPKASILGIDIDKEMLKVATEWFGLQQDDKLKVRIIDGLTYLEETAKKGDKLDAILFDIDSKDPSIGMSCPPKEFVESSVISNVRKIVGERGIFILCLVLRDESLKPSILNKLKNSFPTIVSYKLEDELNEVFICGSNKINSNDIKLKLSEAFTETEKFLKLNNSSNSLSVNIRDFSNALKIN